MTWAAPALDDVLYLYDRDEVEEKARHYLDKVGIGDKADVYPAQLSGGQQQRAAIARARARLGN